MTEIATIIPWDKVEAEDGERIIKYNLNFVTIFAIYFSLYLFERDYSSN